jgi:peptidoglycan/LPS O-acetylase OafA/YrhL
MGAEEKQRSRFEVLDGWRAISILLVLGTHMLPLGPKSLDLNRTAGHLGMSLFFILSGFLITYQLHQRRQLASFFIRRLFRILPLAYAGLLAGAYLKGASASQILTGLVFAQNYAHAQIIVGLSHYWSLCVEVHFYLFMGLLMWVTRFRGFLLLPLVWAALFVMRCWYSPSGAIETLLRVDEILSGCLLALVHLGKLGAWARALPGRLPAAALVLLLLATCHPATMLLHPLRGLAASLLIGHTLLALHPARYRWLGARPLRYIAEISFALYVLHPLSMHGWLGQGDTPIIKYAKRVICFAITFVLAHLSTFHYEQRFIHWAKLLSRRYEGSPAPTLTRATPAPAPTPALLQARR